MGKLRGLTGSLRTNRGRSNGTSTVGQRSPPRQILSEVKKLTSYFCLMVKGCSSLKWRGVCWVRAGLVMRVTRERAGHVNDRSRSERLERVVRRRMIDTTEYV